MNKIEKLIEELCPQGVEFKMLDELGSFYGGLTGKSKNDFSEGNSKFVTYMNIFSNIVVNIDIDNLVKISSEEKQRKINYGDVLFTGSSETPNECGMSSVLTKKVDEPLYLNSFCFGFRFHDTDLFLPDFSKYLFRDTLIRKQISKTASGVTRFNISKKRFAKIKIPIPPLTIQKEIVKILDNFTPLEAKLKAELEAELEARKKQYEHCREQLLMVNDKGLMVDGTKVEFRALGEVADVTKLAGFEFTKHIQYSDKGKIIALRGLNIKNGDIDLTNVKYIDDSDFAKLSRSKLYINDMLFTYVGTIGKVALINENNKYYLAPNVARIRFTNGNLNSKFMRFYFQSFHFTTKQINRYLSSSSLKNLTMTNIRKFQIPIPPLAKQQEIVTILDKFDALVNDISTVLPAEIVARKKQYEYYRNQLLNFKPLEAQDAN